jgi:hypothetical protein
VRKRRRYFSSYSGHNQRRWRRRSDAGANGVQVALKPIDDARGGVDGWAEYCTKDTAATQAEIDRRRAQLARDAISKLSKTETEPSIPAPSNQVRARGQKSI